MGVVDQNDAPEGYVAVKNRDGTCCECFFYQEDGEWYICTLPLDDVLKPRMCSDERRADKQSVIFVEEKGMSEISMYEAPYGHIAVKPEIDSDGMPVCDGCAFDDGLMFSRHVMSVHPITGWMRKM